MIAVDSVNRTWPADLNFHIPDIDIDVPGATMGSEDAGGPLGVDRDVGVPHGDVQVAVDALGPDDAGPSPVYVDDHVADDDILVAAELAVRVVLAATIAVNGERAQPVARDGEGAAGDFRAHGA